MSLPPTERSPLRPDTMRYTSYTESSERHYVDIDTSTDIEAAAAADRRQRDDAMSRFWSDFEHGVLPGYEDAVTPPAYEEEEGAEGGGVGCWQRVRRLWWAVLLFVGGEVCILYVMFWVVKGRGKEGR
ncbi:hypothetical protein BU26DRAFT_566211 [Trematosphaeria pertusa]|uniref:Uncharacterized protein n=1 Tax=Trematosphaeria pertusa TaxID=390896 RepID=A0A6A6IAH8_9PLEO|nr:uncharacterized protein BU26DRAFT_566211 [Trematosphaeria pertusa]KAF2247227.1 hypothetical protein BU26DRAFT_566211 [Trematosphaeria pertusa]